MIRRNPLLNIRLVRHKKEKSKKGNEWAHCFKFFFFFLSETFFFFHFDPMNAGEQKVIEIKHFSNIECRHDESRRVLLLHALF